MPTSTLAIIEPEPSVRATLNAALVQHGFEVVLAAGSLADVGAPLRALSPKLLLLSAARPEPPVVAEVRQWHGARVVVLADVLDPQVLAAAFRSGADGYLRRGLAPEALAQALRVVLTGEKVFPSELAWTIRRAPSLLRLSPRERDVLGGLVRGECDKVIARRLGLSPATVKFYVRGVLRALNASDRKQAAALAWDHLLVGDTGRAA